MKMIKKVAAILSAALIAVTAMAVTAFAGDTIDTAESISNGDKITKTVNAKVHYYKLKSSGKGNLVIDLYSKVKSNNAVSVSLNVYDKDGNEILANDYSATVGEAIQYSNCLDFDYNRLVGNTEGTATYLIKKGTYYLKLSYSGARANDDYGSSTVTFTATFPSSTEAAKFNYMTINLKKGDTLSLGADLTGTGDVTWKSSKPTVASVSSSGKVTAKAKGSAIISAKCGKTTKKIKIVVS